MLAWVVERMFVSLKLRAENEKEEKLWGCIQVDHCKQRRRVSPS